MTLEKAKKPAALLLDTNVWIDFFIGDRPGHLLARSLFNKAFSLEIPLAYAAASVKDVYYIVKSSFKKSSRERSGGSLSQEAAAAAEITGWACVDQMHKIAAAVGMDSLDVEVASHQRKIHRDFEDDLVIAAAKRLDVDCLVTNDEKLLRHCPVAALDVNDMIEVLDQVEENVVAFFEEGGPLYEEVAAAAGEAIREERRRFARPIESAPS